MTQYDSQQTLKDAIAVKFDKYIAEFADIPEAHKDTRCAVEVRTPAQNLAYQVGWTTLLLQWERDEQAGLEVATPSAQFRWNQLGELYQWFNERYAGQSLASLERALRENVEHIYQMIDALSEHELFEPHQRKWADGATKSAAWPVAKFIHINTVSPFGSFRTKIRKWKKAVL